MSISGLFPVTLNIPSSNETTIRCYNVYSVSCYKHQASRAFMVMMKKHLISCQKLKGRKWKKTCRIISCFNCKRSGFRYIFHLSYECNEQCIDLAQLLSIKMKVLLRVKEFISPIHCLCGWQVEGSYVTLSILHHELS